MLPPVKPKEKYPDINSIRKPTRLDRHVVATIWVEKCENGRILKYIQANPNMHEPNWVRLGEVLEHSLIKKDRQALIEAIKCFNMHG